MTLSIDFSHLSNHLQLIREQGRNVQLFAFRGDLHRGKTSLLQEANREQRYRLLYWEYEGSDSSLHSLDVDCLCRVHEKTDAGEQRRFPELNALEVLSPQIDEVVMGEKDYPRLIQLEKYISRSECNGRIVRREIERDIDGIPWGRETDSMPAIERFQARFVPQSLKMARELWHSHAETLECVLSLTQENLEKSQGLEIETLEVLSDGAGQRLCVRAWAGKTLIVDNVFLGSPHG